MIKELSIIFPLYNEEKRLKRTFLEILNFKKKINKNKKIEIIFVNDGSSDNSQLLIESFIEKTKTQNFNIKIFKLKKNMGKGYAIKHGVKKTSKKWILTTDIDLSVSLNQILEWEKYYPLHSKNIIFGSRNLSQSKVEKNFFRFVLGNFFTFFVKLFLNISLFDTQCGFKLYKKTTAKKIFSQLTNYGFTHDLELVIISKKLEFEIIELPVKWTHKKGSKLNIFFEPIKMFLNIIYLRFKYTSLKD